MSAGNNVRSRKIPIFSNIYTALLALALGAVGATAGFVVFKCLTQYETILKIVQIGR